MADWLVSIQLPEGAFQGGRIDSRPVVPVTFNTGQVLLGLAAAHGHFGGYAEPLQRAADWLVRTQDSDGCWRLFPSPFALSGEKVYETHVAWALLEADKARRRSRLCGGGTCKRQMGSQISGGQRLAQELLS